ncbi:Sensor histidine kinase YpdA [compost metagenome]
MDESLYDLPIMKLTLQPIVENAIYHGIKNKEGRGLIRISGSRQGDRACLEVYDDGAGIPPEKLERLRHSIENGSADTEESPITFGLRNVHMRLRLHFGEHSGLKLTSAQGQYTKAAVIIPWRDEEGEEPC